MIFVIIVPGSVKRVVTALSGEEEDGGERDGRDGEDGTEGDIGVEKEGAREEELL